LTAELRRADRPVPGTAIGGTGTFISSPFFSMANIATAKASRPASTDAAKEGSPVRETFQVGSVRVTVFTDGNVSLRRSYRTPEGEWKSTSTLRPGDLAHAVEALSKCLGAVDKPAATPSA